MCDRLSFSDWQVIVFSDKMVQAGSDTLRPDPGPEKALFTPAEAVGY